MLELTSFEKAIQSLDDALKWYHRGGAADVPLDILRDSVIQRFEYTYELAWKMIKRWLEQNVGPSHVDGVSRKELFRLAAENRLIDDPMRWFAYHEACNQTSHVYDESVAEDVFGVIGDFLNDAACLLRNIMKRND